MLLISYKYFEYTFIDISYYELQTISYNGVTKNSNSFPVVSLNCYVVDAACGDCYSVARGTLKTRE